MNVHCIVRFNITFISYFSIKMWTEILKCFECLNESEFLRQESWPADESLTPYPSPLHPCACRNETISSVATRNPPAVEWLWGWSWWTGAPAALCCSWRNLDVSLCCHKKGMTVRGPQAQQNLINKVDLFHSFLYKNFCAWRGICFKDP